MRLGLIRCLQVSLLEEPVPSAAGSRHTGAWPCWGQELTGNTGPGACLGRELTGDKGRQPSALQSPHSLSLKDGGIPPPGTWPS